MRSAGTHLLIAFLVAFLVRGPAYAAQSPLTPAVYAGKGGTRVLVVVAPVDARAKAMAGLIEHAAEAAVDQSDRFDVMRGVDAFDGEKARVRYDKANEAASLATQAKKALEDLDSAAATKLYAEAVAAWKKADLTKGIDGLIEAQIGKAAGHSVSEENPAAKQEIERALVLAPKTKLSDAQFPPELLKFAESRRTAFRTAKGKLTVRSDPPGARVWVDGSYRGVSPVTVDQLASGEKHLVVAALAGFSMEAAEVAVGEQLVRLKPAEQAAQLQSAIDRVAREPDGPARDSAAKELGTGAMADQVLLVVVKRGAGDALEATALRLDVKDGHNYAYQSGTLPSDLKGATDWVTALLASDSPRDGKRPVTHFTSGAAGGRGGGGGVSSARIAGGIMLGGAVVAGAAWAVFGVNALGQVNVYKNTAQVEGPKSANAANAGRTFALFADISWAVGAALLVFGVLLAFTPLFGATSGGRGGSSAPKAAAEDDAMRAYRAAQELQRMADEERARKAQEAPPPEEQPVPSEKPAEEKKPEEKAAPPPKQEEKPPEEKKKKLTPAEEKAEKKRKAEEEKAEKKRKADEAKAEKKRAAEEAKKKAADEKAEKKRKAEEEKQKAADEKKRAADEKKQKTEDEKKRAEEDNQKKTDEEKKQKEEEQRKADEAEARRIDEERRKKEEEERKREEVERRERGEEEPEKKKKPDEDDLRNF